MSDIVKNVAGTSSDTFDLGASQEKNVRIVRGADHKLYLVDDRYPGVDKLVPIDIEDLNDVPIKPTTGTKNLRVQDGVISWAESSDAILADSREPHGFVWGSNNEQQSTITWDDATRTFTIAPIDTEFAFYVRGTKFIKTAQESITIDDTIGKWVIYYDSNGVLQKTLTPPDCTLVTIVFKVYWCTPHTKAIFRIDCRHGLSMSAETNHYLIQTNKSSYASGLEAFNYTETGDGSLDSHAQLAFTDGKLLNRDLDYYIVNNSPQQLDPFIQPDMIWFDGTTPQLHEETATNFAFISNAGVPQWNEYNGSTWVLSNVPDTYYFATWIVSIPNFGNGSTFGIPGMYINTNLTDCISDNFFSKPQIERMFPCKELEFRALVVFRYHTINFTNSVHTAIRYVADLSTDSAKTVVQLSQRTILPMSDNRKDYFTNNSTNPLVVTSFPYSGYEDRIISTFSVVVSRSGTSGTVYAELWDFNNNLLMAQIPISGATSDIKQLYSTTDLQNIPALPTVLEVRVYKGTTRSSNIKAHCAELN